ncbi:MAG TPA: DUF4013 domain-containing protein, partial [Roseiflexaceae bacterium]|nr:DUF4013 domain-containing protein [Roseiflexaceae bacterium]
MDIGKAFSYVFEDERWISKVLIGGLILIVPILNFAAFGYLVKIAQNVAQRNPRPLPEWSGQLGDHFMRGLNVFVIYLVYLLPVFILEGLFFCVTGGLASRVDAGSDASGAAFGLLGVCLFPLILLLALVLFVLIFAAIARYAATNTLSEAFKFGEIIAGVRRNLSPWLMLLLVYILAQFVGGLGIIACGIGVFFTAFYAQCVLGHALGQ